jgi:hypothetical protein
MKNFLILIAILIPTIFITVDLTQQDSDEKLYQKISNDEMKLAEMLAKQKPEVLMPYFLKVKKQGRNLTELEYKTFNYYKNTSVRN